LTQPLHGGRVRRAFERNFPIERPH
jgi:hypothetical protein